ncbi:hypothetical protein F5887DRAFT_950484 [Amanita rubescens]|nr:hypothetical protein F5887DRAFT_950484 [Amanita rubescens]
MADHAEHAFTTAFLNTLASQPVVFTDDYQQPKEHSLKRVPILPTPVPPPPATKRLQSAEPSSSTAGINITFKSIKPPASYSLSVHPTDTISTLKSQLADSHPSAPPADAQRLLLKGKSLADNKLLKEYSIKDGDVINLMVKPGTNWDPSNPIPRPTNITLSPMSPPSLSSDKPATGAPRRGRHQRIPSVVLSPSPSTSTTDLLAGTEGNSGSGAPQEKDIILTLDTMDKHSQPTTTFVANPEYWEKLFRFLKSEFINDSDAIRAFEDYLRASKGSLTPNEIAKIRDHTGVVGMAGT